MAAPERSARDDELLTTLLSEVNRARTRVRSGRGVPGGSYATQDQERRCEVLVEALEAYARAVAAAGVPLPYRYRNEMRLYRSVYPRAARGSAEESRRRI